MKENTYQEIFQFNQELSLFENSYQAKLILGKGQKEKRRKKMSNEVMNQHLTVAVKQIKPRRSHCKSRNGCLHCKQRRVKCDEQHPICGPCFKRHLPCAFQNQQSSSSKSLSRSSQCQTLSPLDPLSNAPDLTDVLSHGLFSSTRLLELKLLFHFSTSTYRSIVISSLDHSFMQVHVPELALSHPYLMDSIFVMSALHLEFLDPRRSKDWLRIALSYQNRALKRFAEVLQEINSKNCKAVAICSMLIKFATIAIPAVSGDTSTSDPISEFLIMKSLSEGARTILLEYEADLRVGPINEWFATSIDFHRGRVPRLQLVEQPEDSHFSSDQVSLYNKILQSLDDLINCILEEQGPNQEIYLHYCRVLRESLRPLSRCRLMITCSSWPLEVSIEKLKSLGSDDIFRTIMSHYAVVLHLNHDKWFAYGAGKRLLRSLHSNSQEIKSNELRAMIEWACKTVGL